MRWIGIGLAGALALGCGTSLCDDLRDPDRAFCVDGRLTLDEAIGRARNRQPELADATLVRVTSGATGTLNVDGRDSMWQLIFVVADGSDRTLTVTPDRTDVRPGGAAGSSCDGVAGEALPSSTDATQNAVLHFEETHGRLVHGMGTSLVFFYEHACYDPANPGTTHVEIAKANDVSTDHWFYRVDAQGELTQLCGPCALGDVDVCTDCRPL